MKHSFESESDITLISEKGEWEISRNTLTLHNNIGMGSFGSVYVASWRYTKVAAKVLERSNEDMSIHEYRSELRSLSQTRHPNIVQFFGACTLDKPYIILIEYMSRGNLETNRSSLNKDEKKAVLIDIASGIAYLHNRMPRCLIHRDLKPNNILLTVSGRAKIADFGLSKFLSNHNDTFVMTGETGTYRYMAPEVIMHKEYNASVDVWSFGMIIYFLFFDIPFRSMSTRQIVQCVIDKDFKLNMKNKNDIEKIILHCTHWNFSLRPHSIQLINMIENMKIKNNNFPCFKS